MNQTLNVYAQYVRRYSMRAESHNGSINGDYDKKSMHETAPYARDDDEYDSYNDEYSYKC